MSLLSGLTNAWGWFKKVFVSHTKSAASIAVTITETIKTLLDNPVEKFLENVADAVTHSQVPTEIADEIKGAIPKILVIELGIEGLPDSPTEADILLFEQRILTAFGVNSNLSKLYTTLSAQVYGIIQNTISTTPESFADWVKAVEAAYQDYLADLAAQNTIGISRPFTPTDLSPTANVPIQQPPATSEGQVSPNV